MRHQCAPVDISCRHATMLRAVQSAPSTRANAEETVFRRKRGPGETQGFDRISKLIEDRQRELGDDDAPITDLEGDTIVFGGETVATAPEPEEEGESVSLLGLRGQPGPLPNTPQPSAPPAAEQQPPTPPTAEEAPPAERSGGFEADTLPYAPQAPAAERPLPMPVPNIGASTAGASLVAADAVWEGKLRSDGDIRVE